MSSEDFQKLIGAVPGRVIVDIGTGDGSFVYRAARQNSQNFYIGIDPSIRPLEKISERIYRNALKGGAPNALYIEAAVENLPEELHGIANEVHILFPWGSLLHCVVTGNLPVLRQLRCICAQGATMELVLSLNPERDFSTMQRFQLPELSIEYIGSFLSPKYYEAGFRVVECKALPISALPNLKTSWCKRLGSGRSRSIYVLRAVAF